MVQVSEAPRQATFDSWIKKCRSFGLAFWQLYSFDSFDSFDSFFCLPCSFWLYTTQLNENAIPGINCLNGSDRSRTNARSRHRYLRQVIWCTKREFIKFHCLVFDSWQYKKLGNRSRSSSSFLSISNLPQTSTISTAQITTIDGWFAAFFATLFAPFLTTMGGDNLATT